MLMIHILLISIYCSHVSAINIEFNNLTSPQYLGPAFDGLVGILGLAVTRFNDKTGDQPSDSSYYFVSDFTVNENSTLQRAGSISNIFNDKLQQFDNSKNAISAQLPYQIFPNISNAFAPTNFQSTCTNPNTFDIMICYDTTYPSSRSNVFCNIFFNDADTPYWSQEIPIINQPKLKVTTYSLQCVEDGYLILFQPAEFQVEGSPNTYYTLLNLKGDIVVDSKPVFQANEFNYSIFWEIDLIRSSMVERTDENGQYLQSNIMLELCVTFRGQIDNFFLYYTKIDDVDGDGPLYVNDSISGNRLLSRPDSDQRVEMDYYDIIPSQGCCFMTPYIKDNIDLSETYLYLNIIDTFGDKLFENDTLIATIDRDLLPIDGNFSASIYQLNVKTNDDDNTAYFGIFYFSKTDIYVQLLSINTVDISIDVLESQHLINLESVDEIPFRSIRGIYIDSKIEYDDNILFMVYQLIYNPNITSPASVKDYIQTWKVSYS